MSDPGPSLAPPNLLGQLSSEQLQRLCNLAVTPLEQQPIVLSLQPEVNRRQPRQLRQPSKGQPCQ